MSTLSPKVSPACQKEELGKVRHQDRTSTLEGRKGQEPGRLLIGRNFRRKGQSLATASLDYPGELETRLWQLELVFVSVLARYPWLGF